MNPVLADLLQLLELESLEVNLFRGESRDIGTRQVYGGQVLGQALAAAYRTVDRDRQVHSLHAYFLRRGDVNAPIVYEVDRQRDGRSFSNRRVVAIQHGRPILNLAASFQLSQAGVEHADEMPPVPDPESLPDIADGAVPGFDRLPEKLRRFMVDARAFSFRPINPQPYVDPQPAPARKQSWFRALDRLPDDQRLHEALLAYASDYGLVSTAMLPHGISMLQDNLQIASLDHAMWFHRPFRADQWLLYDCDSPSASGCRGLARGRIFDQQGRLVASTAQEGLIRLWETDD